MVVESVKLIGLIEVKVVKGTGTQENPTRLVTQYWNYENHLVFEIDPISTH
ncbi:hypothetical protein [Streptococcus suis]|uniref:hypothetical protein n=1 Tax=Streptococcus suis TaxID=1307 RepID=UPI0001949717|nr:hypothetical protein [Streptococcus suis]AGF87591.1 hypothetical protein phi891591_0054 [Streptococcus phage phi891591]MBM6438936.1 hypothetical protein [Streptococcus suis]MCH1722005.1 hypothetical protein [Streptococcus suis]MCL4913430.1 hypothetical protein [Streptococcus suis]NQK26880.1 hypothetical protein [Streptococcus suis]